MLVSLSSTSPPRAYCSISNPLLKLPALRPVSTQEEKHWIGLGAFPSCIIHTARPKKLKVCQLFIIRVADHRFKLEQKPYAQVQFCSNPMLIFLCGNRPLIFTIEACLLLVSLWCRCTFLQCYILVGNFLSVTFLE